MKTSEEDLSAFSFVPPDDTVLPDLVTVEEKLVGLGFDWIKGSAVLILINLISPHLLNHHVLVILLAGVLLPGGLGEYLGGKNIHCDMLSSPRLLHYVVEI